MEAGFFFVTGYRLFDRRKRHAALRHGRSDRPELRSDRVALATGAVLAPDITAVRRPVGIGRRKRKGRAEFELPDTRRPLQPLRRDDTVPVLRARFRIQHRIRAVRIHARLLEFRKRSRKLSEIGRIAFDTGRKRGEVVHALHIERPLPRGFGGTACEEPEDDAERDHRRDRDSEIPEHRPRDILPVLDLPAFEEVEPEDDAGDTQDRERLEKEPCGDLALEEGEDDGDEIADDGDRCGQEHEIREPLGKLGFGPAFVLAEFAEPDAHRGVVKREPDEECCDGIVDRTHRGRLAVVPHTGERIRERLADDAEIERSERSRHNTEQDEREEIDHDIFLQW